MRLCTVKIPRSRSLILAAILFSISAKAQNIIIDDPNQVPKLQTFTELGSITTQTIFTTSSSPTQSLTTSVPNLSSPDIPPTQTSGSSDGSSTDRSGLIVSTVCGSIFLVVGGCLIALWMVLRERRRREALPNDNDLSPPIAPPPPDTNNQGIWDGRATVLSNPTKEVPA